MASFFGDDVFELDAVEEEAPVEELKGEDALRVMAKEAGLIEGDEPAEGETSDTESEEKEEVETPSESYGFKSEEEFQSAALKAVEAKLGVSIDAVVAMLEDFGTFRNEQLVDKQQAPLKSEWGDEYADRFEQVVERFKTLSPDMQKSLDNVDGARLIWALIEKEQGAVTPTKGVPKFDKAGVVNNRQSAKFMYKLSEIESMSAADYQRNIEKINTAFNRGLVDTEN